jgi:hypothetical protein
LGDLKPKKAAPDYGRRIVFVNWLC